MSDQEKDRLSSVENLEVAPLSDEDLELASGGCSCSYTTGACSAKTGFETDMAGTQI